MLEHDFISSKEVQIALRQWHGAKYENESPLSNLSLYRKALERGDNPHQATNQILMSALYVLEKNYSRDAELIRMRFLDNQPMHSIASQFHVGDSTVYVMSKNAIHHLTEVIQEQEHQARVELRALLSQRLPSTTYENLVGMEAYIQQLSEIFIQDGASWIVSIEGMGGTGKTSLTHALVNHLIENYSFDQVGWVSARQYNFDLTGRIEDVEGPALTVEVLIDELVHQLMPDFSSTTHLPFAQRITMLHQHLKKIPHLIVIDNLETVVDVQSLLPTLKQLTNPTRFILTSRQQVSGESQVYHFKIPELDRQSVFTLIRQDARESNLLTLADCMDSELQPIYDVVGGNPLAIRLFVGLMHVYSLKEVLHGLREAEGKPVDELYKFIYKQAWDKLDDLSKIIFMIMLLISEEGEDLDYLIEVSNLERNQLYTTLNHLVLLNLVIVQGDIHQRLYKVHNLTKTFLYQKVLQ